MNSVTFLILYIQLYIKNENSYVIINVDRLMGPFYIKSEFKFFIRWYYGYFKCNFRG